MWPTCDSALGGPLPRQGTDARRSSRISRVAWSPALTTMSGPRYFGFVIGGSVPAALAADWLTSTWDQNAVLQLATPAAALIEEIAARVAGRAPRAAARGRRVGFTSGDTMANFVGLAAGPPRGPAPGRLGRRGPGPHRRAADPRPDRPGRARLDPRRVALRRPGPRPGRARPDRRRGPDGPASPSRRCSTAGPNRPSSAPSWAR